MNEKDLEVLEQYELQVKATWRGRGSFLCDTDKGLVQLTEFSGSKERLAFQNCVLLQLHEQGELVDRILPNKEGELVTANKEENRFVAKMWFQGRECDTRNKAEVNAAVRHLAELHEKMSLPKPEEGEEEALFKGEMLEHELMRHNRELKRVRTYIRQRKQKNEFERRFLKAYEIFEDQTLHVMEELKKQNGRAMYEKNEKERRICHGDYSQHHVLITGEKIATVNFSKCCLDLQIADFCYFFRKMMEKQNWSPQVGMGMLEAYQSVRPFAPDEYTNLCIRLAYPEKFWKLANQYYNHKKAWMPEKNLQKLEMLILQEKRRNEFLNNL